MAKPPPGLAFKSAVLAIVTFPFLGVVLAIVLLWQRYVFPSDIALMFLFVLVTGLGITIGYHRMLTHQGFRAPEWLRVLLLIAGCMGFEGPPDQWMATHIKHHAHSDDDGDPHSPLEGFWHAHMGWMLGDESADVRVWAPQVLADRSVQFVSRFHYLWILLSLGLPLLLGGWTGFVWGALVRIFLTTHITWSVNSICHTFGKRPYETTDESRNNWIIGLIGFGEGWHNNHHAFPRNAFHGMRWWQFDLSGIIIRAWEKAGLVWEVQRVSADAAHAQQTRALASHMNLLGMRNELIASVVQAKSDVAALSAAAVRASLTPSQLAQLKAFQSEAGSAFDAMHRTLLRTTRLKKRRLMLVQADLHARMEALKAQWSLVKGLAVS